MHALLVLLLWLSGAEGYSTGAPSAVCSSMTPSHSGTPSSATPFLYTLTPSNVIYNPGDVLTVTLSGTSPFMGFLVKAVDQSGTVVGTMTASTSSRVLSCQGVSGGALTHTDKGDKTSFTFQWKAPPTNMGFIVFRATVVQDYYMFWVDQEMVTISPATVTTQPPVVTTGAAPVTTALPPVVTTPQITTPTTPVQDDGTIRYDPECGSTKGCFVDCAGTTCKYMVTWMDDGDSVLFELYGRPELLDSWIAVGFSKDSRMGDDSVTECVHNSGVVRVFNSYNPDLYNTRLSNPTLGLSSVSGSYNNGVLSCTFRRLKRVSNEPKLFDLEQDWHIMYAYGGALTGFQINMHSTDSGKLPPASAAKVDYQSVAVIGSAGNFPLVKAHGCLMIFAWVLFTGVGIVVARYYKSVWSDKTFFKQKIWFQIHRSCMIAAFVTDIVAFIIIFVDVGGYSNIPNVQGRGYLQAHPILGIIVTILVVANPVMSLFRPGPGTKNRPIFNWAHWGVGMAAYILSAVTICFGFQLGKSSTPDYAIYIMIGYVIYIIAFDVLMEVLEYFDKKQSKVQGNAMEMKVTNVTDSGIPNSSASNAKAKKSQDILRTSLLTSHIAFTGAFALVLTLVVALN